MTRPYNTNRRRCRSMPVNKFFDPTTGKFCRLNDTPWHLKNIEGEPGYFLQMDMTMQYQRIDKVEREQKLYRNLLAITLIIGGIIIWLS